MNPFEIADYLWRMSRNYKLAIWECFFQIRNNRPLPFWMQVELNLVNQNNAGTLKRIVFRSGFAIAKRLAKSPASANKHFSPSDS